MLPKRSAALRGRRARLDRRVRHRDGQQCYCQLPPQMPVVVFPSSTTACHQPELLFPAKGRLRFAVDQDNGDSRRLLRPIGPCVVGASLDEDAARLERAWDGYGTSGALENC
jgi:hypothetical protein